MKLAEFDFELPPELIALYPPYHDAVNPDNHRDEGRLMVIDRATGKIDIEKKRQFKSLLDYFNEGDVLVANDAKVFPARLFGQKEKTGSDIEVFLLRELNAQTHLWDVIVEPARKIRVGNKIYFGDSGLVAEVIDNTTSRGRTIRFLYHGTSAEFAAIVDQIGETPLPREIPREVEPEDRNRYQTIYAQNSGAVAVPGAGIHFSPHMFKSMQIKGIDMAYLTLNVGLNSYKPVEVDDMAKFKPDSEPYVVPKVTAERVNKAIDEGKKIIAIGTSSMRGMEASLISDGQSLRLKENKHWTDKFYLPPNADFKITTAMVTNFHLPKTLPYITACAFGGLTLMRSAYELARKEKFRWFTFGDSMLIL